ncbi:MAG: hypothetical protein ABR907_07265 [Terracidiphilus sp.]|jgi:hypothetical protein
MAIVQNHAWSGDESKRLCDLVFESLPRESDPKREYSSYCKGTFLKQKSAMFWIKHTKRTIIFYPVCEDTREITGSIRELLPSGVALRVRPVPRKAIALSTPLFFKIEADAQAKSMGPLLQYLIAQRSDSSLRAGYVKSEFWRPPSETGDTEDSVEEGNRTTVLVNRYERKAGNREACIRANGTSCVVCGFDFPSVFGSIGYGSNGKGYIHVHHLTALGSLKGKARMFNPARDLVPVCPNCHEMLHRKDPPYTIDELKEIAARARESANSWAHR